MGTSPLVIVGIILMSGKRFIPIMMYQNFNKQRIIMRDLSGKSLDWYFIHLLHHHVLDTNGILNCLIYSNIMIQKINDHPLPEQIITFSGTRQFSFPGNIFIIWNHLSRKHIGGLEHEFDFSIYWVFHHPNWLIHIFRRVGWLNHQPGVGSPSARRWLKES